MSDVEAAALAVIAVEECDGDGAAAIAALTNELPSLDTDERAVAERAVALIKERTHER